MNLSYRNFFICLTSAVVSLFIFFELLAQPTLVKVIKKIPGFSFILKQREAIQFKSKVITLNYAIPEFESLVNYIFSSRENNGILEGYLKYYENVRDIFPELADSYAILGFSNYYLGNKQQAIKFYKKASELNPAFFYFYYNLGLLYLSEARYQEAVDVLQKAIQCDPKKVLESIYSSRVYVQLIGAMNETQKSKVANLQADYKEAMKFLMMGKYCLDNEITQRINLGKLTLKIF